MDHKKKQNKTKKTETNCIKSTKNSARNFFFLFCSCFLNKTKTSVCMRVCVTCGCLRVYTCVDVICACVCTCVYIIYVCVCYVCVSVCACVLLCVLWHTCGGQRTACVPLQTVSYLLPCKLIASWASLLYLHLPPNSSALCGLRGQELHPPASPGKALSPPSHLPKPNNTFCIGSETKFR